MKTSTDESLNILIVAAEASSAAYATHLIKNWRDEGRRIRTAGIGNREMESLGFEILGRTEELAVVGLQEIIAHWSDIKKAFYSIVEYAEKEKPDFVLLMDYPEFNLRLAKKLKALGVPVVYYISPQIWAWRTYRVHQIKKIVDLMLVIFPFEESFYKKHNVPVKFVGHPLLELLSDKLPKAHLIDQKRQELLSNLPTEKTRILGLMPGSRRSELKFNLKIQIDSAHRLIESHPEIQPVMLVAPSLDLTFVKQESEKYGFRGSYLQEEPFFMIQISDQILCASGTATLMVALCEKPMVIMYKMNAVSAFLAKRLVKHIPYFGMVNLILNKEAVPERFQERANPRELAQCLQNIFENKHNQRTQILDDLRLLKIRLGEGGGLKNLSKSLLEFVDHQRRISSMTASSKSPSLGRRD